MRAIKTKKLQKLPVNFEPEFRKFFQSKKIPALIDLKELSDSLTIGTRVTLQKIQAFELLSLMSHWITLNPSQ